MCGGDLPNERLFSEFMYEYMYNKPLGDTNQITDKHVDVLLSVKKHYYESSFWETYLCFKK